MLDLGDVVVHVFTAEQREYFDLETFYGAAEEASSWPPAASCICIVSGSLRSLSPASCLQDCCVLSICHYYGL